MYTHTHTQWATHTALHTMAPLLLCIAIDFQALLFFMEAKAKYILHDNSGGWFS